jgi:3-hydroxyacyl-CoA dehydrogenase
MEAKKVTIIGSGLIGRSWALVRTIKSLMILRKYNHINYCKNIPTILRVKIALPIENVI